MHLQSQPLPDSANYTAAQIKDQIGAVIERLARHFGIRQLQDIFREHPDRLYHWVTDRTVPPGNNRSERELRPTVIACKVSFESDSEAGARTREILMSLLHTLHKRHADAQGHFNWVLDRLAADPQRDPFALLFLNDTS